MLLTNFSLSSDHSFLSSYLSEHPDFLIIQDLDGVCMGLVSDPLTRTLDNDYLEASLRLKNQFYVLTNGEHIGPRGINAILDRQQSQLRLPAVDYLPGLAAGGVQWKDNNGEISHPGVTEQEITFLSELPERFEGFLRELLPDFGLSSEQTEKAIASAVLDNPVSPTLNLNVVYELCGRDSATYGEIQRQTEAWLRELLNEASGQELDGSFFLHLAPNHGKSDGIEHLAPATDTAAGTTDFQFMLSGAIKEAGVLYILNQVMFQRTGTYPLGADFNVRSVPHDLYQLADIAASAFRDCKLPILIGVGDTVTSAPDGNGGYRRGGSDRGFLTLLQMIGKRLETEAAVLLVDSSGGEVRRPGLPVPVPEHQSELPGISDAHDPLQLNFVFPGGHEEYIRFYRELSTALD